MLLGLSGYTTVLPATYKVLLPLYSVSPTLSSMSLIALCVFTLLFHSVSLCQPLSKALSTFVRALTKNRFNAGQGTFAKQLLWVNFIRMLQNNNSRGGRRGRDKGMGQEGIRTSDIQVQLVFESSEAKANKSRRKKKVKKERRRVEELKKQDRQQAGREGRIGV